MLQDEMETQERKLEVPPMEFCGATNYGGKDLGTANVSFETDDLLPMDVEEPVKEDPQVVGLEQTNEGKEGIRPENYASLSPAGANWEVLDDPKDVESISAMSCDDKNSSPSKVATTESSDDEFSFGSDDDSFALVRPSHVDPSSIGKAFNMDLLRDCIQKGEEHLLKVQGKDVILVVGKTGTGKSTFIQGIAGKAFKESVYTIQDKIEEKEATKKVFDAVDPVPGFEIGHAKSSRTKHIQCHICEGHSGTKNSVVTNPGLVYYLDTPGFEDTEGEEVDIATSAMLAQIAKECRSMRFVIMIHYVSLLEDRGGAMRSTLKFMRNFVSDFEQHKKSFMFLFTHADEIKNVPESLEGARKSLLNEIVLTIQGTSGDDEAMALLSFIKACLKKNYSFVDVLHPLKTDFSKIAGFVDNKLKPMKISKENKSTSPCILTTSSQLRLTGAITNMLGELRLSLKQKPVNITEVCQIQSTFRYFEKYIQFEDMRKAVAECHEIMDQHVKELNEIVTNEVRNGTFTASKTLFNECNIADLKDAILQLQAIDPVGFDMEVARIWISKEVIRFQEELLLPVEQQDGNFYGLDQNLRKLRVWCTLDSEFQKVFDEAIARANKVVGKLVSEISRFKPAKIASSSENEQRKLVETFYSVRILKSIDEDAKGLSSLLKEIPKASKVYQEFVWKLKNYFEGLDKTLWTSSSKSQFHFKNPQYLGKTENQIRFLEALSAQIDETNLQEDILPLVRDVREVMEIQIVQRFAKACTDAEVRYLNGDNSFPEDLKALESVASKFSCFKGVHWKEMEFSYQTVVDRIKSKLKALSGELDEMSRHSKHHGITHGNHDGTAVMKFVAWRWFDEFLPPEDRFMETCLTKIQNDYCNMFVSKRDVILDTLHRLTSDEGSKPVRELIEHTKTLCHKLSEIVEFTEFGSAIMHDELLAHSTQIFNRVCEYIENRALYWRNILKTWREAISNEKETLEELSMATKELNSAIAEVTEIINNMTSEMAGKNIKSTCQSIKGEMLTACSSFKEEVLKSLASQQITYANIAELKSRVQALGDFPHTSPYLPQIEELKEAARQRVDRDAKAIEEMVEQTSEFDQIDTLIKDLEKAAILDDFISQETASRLRPLKRLRREKEIDSDELIKDMIEKDDFKGLGQFLEPLAKSSNQIRKNKFNKSLEMIANSLTAMDDKLKVEMETTGKMTEEKGSKIAFYMKILKDADKELGKYLRYPKFVPSLASRLAKSKKSINERYRRLQVRTMEAIEDANFVLVEERIYRGAIIVNRMGNLLDEHSNRKRKEALRAFSTLKNSISTFVNTFVKSSFTEYERLEKILGGLKPVTTIGNPIYRGLSQLYAESTRDLATRVDDLLRNIEKSTEDTQCYDDSIIVLENLLRSYEKGLKTHLSQESFEHIETLLEALTGARNEQECSMDFDRIATDVVLREFAERLEKSAPSSSYWQRLRESLGNDRVSSFLFGSKSSYTYNRLQNKLRCKVIERYERGYKALSKREFGILKESLEFLFLTDSMTGKHVHLAGEKLKDLEQKAIESFRSLCETSQEILQAENCREFESLFDDFRGFVLDIPCLMSNTNAKKSFCLTNQLVYERLCGEISTLNTTLEGFEFMAMKQKIEDVRRFGGFIADSYSLFHEELTLHSHVEKDKWLDDLKCKILEHFQNGRDLKRIKYYAILGAPPSASKEALKRAYRKKCLTCHPDKCKDKRFEQEWKEKFQTVQNAYDELDSNFQCNNDLKPFDNAVRGLGEKLRETTRKALNEQNYEQIETLLFKIDGIDVLDNLVKPEIQTNKIREDVFELVKNHVLKIRTEVDTNWSERNYQDLNLNIKDLKMMEEKFKSHPRIFSTSWNTGIINKVEYEIENLGKDACMFLKDKSMAESSRDEFRRCFMRMGAVLVELPEFKDYTKKVMSDILESCLNSNWGYSFVFELGLSLQKGGDMDDEQDEHEARIAQNLVSEFKHFKEVLTMVWNEETIQKPPEDTIRGIRGEYLAAGSMHTNEIILNTETLLEQYSKFDSAYTSFLGEYLNPEADMKVLVRKTKGICEILKPVSCDNGFGDETKRALPSILAGIFAVFTIIKSGESYNRLEQDVNGRAIDSKKLLMKPHNIQVLTLLCMFGCGTSESDSLQSQLMQIRTGEGKSMILGAAAVVFGLLGFRVRCICYSEYLSNRDFELFRDVFDLFGLLSLINYSKITTLSEETTANKGDIRGLTLSLLLGETNNTGQHRHNCLNLNQSDQETNDNVSMDVERDSTASTTKYKKLNNTWAKKRDFSLTKCKGSSLTMQKVCKENKEEIMLVDEVDVFFGSEFYGQTYNQVAQLKEPEVEKILREIWHSHKSGGKRLRLADIKASPIYTNLVHKIQGFEYLLENEIALMLDQVRRVDDEPRYHLDYETDMIGYKVQDTICYNVTYGYRTVFAYLKEADNGNLRDSDATLSRVLTMPISCGQFSYANIKPTRILGVSGTLEVMNDYEKRVLQKYGVNKYLYIPSVYGKSNFTFDKVGDGVSIENGVGDYFHKITNEISSVATKEKRAVIVFFSDSKRLKEYTSSAFYRKLGRRKEILTESKSANEKSFVISKAATTGQITLCTSVFGRGTDFFCKDSNLEKNKGVHVIQTFLSADMSEEIQIQGRTARQGKQGSYKLILLDKDLEEDFDIMVGTSEQWPRTSFYAKLCEARNKSLEEKYAVIATNLLAAKAQDQATHEYFDALLDSNTSHAKNLLKDMYLKMKKAHVGKLDLDLAFAIDVTGSMCAYGNAIASTIESLLLGSNSILVKLKAAFPDTEFSIRVGILGFRDIDDGKARQFQEMSLNLASHFSENLQEVLRFVKNLTNSFSGGGDIAEDHLGAIKRCLEWNSVGDWEGNVKALLLLTDAPAHEYATSKAQNIDNYSVRHPLGLTVDSVVDELIQKDVDLFVCSFDPANTDKFEKVLGDKFNAHPKNDGRDVTIVPLVPKNTAQGSSHMLINDSNKHNIFVLDESGSMQHDWSGVVSVFNKYIQNRRQHQKDSDLVSVVQFDGNSRVTCDMINITNVPNSLGYNGGGTCFHPAATSACAISRRTPPSHKPVIIFMSDGQANDSHQAANEFASLNRELKSSSGIDLELHVIGFGGGTDTTQLQEIARASPKGRVHTASSIDSLTKVFVQIAGGGDAVAKILEAEISKRIADAVTDRLSAEYLG